MSGLPLNIDVAQIFMHFLNFAILMGGLYILLYKPVRDFMEKRTEHYAGIHADADETIRKIEEQKAEYEQKLSNVQKEIDELKGQAAAEAKLASEKKLAEARNEADRIISDAKEKAVAEKEKIVAEGRNEIKALAEEAARKILDENGDMYSSFAGSVK